METETKQADVGLIGLAVMGQNLVLNMADHGYRVAVYNRTTERVDEFTAGPAKGASVVGARSIEDFVDLLARPRKVILMVKAGKPVDGMIDQLTPLLEPGDLIVDGGNSYYKDTARREEALRAHGIHYLGAGISGGEEGARHGPSIMPGGSQAAWNLVGQILTDISAKAGEDGAPCCTYVGPDGAGHFVKMVHNGIEYGDMQLISEAYYLLREVLGMTPDEMADVFAEWNDGKLKSYLIEITADILRKKDDRTGRPLVDVILDEARQKGTGKWTSHESLDLGTPAPTITQAVFARFISALKEERVAASKVLKGPALPQGGYGMHEGPATGNADGANTNTDGTVNGINAGGSTSGTIAGGALPPAGAEGGGRHALIEAIRQALYASKICSYAQGFALLQGASRAYDWDLDLGALARIWRGGCIIRAQFLNRIHEAYNRNTELANLLLDDYFRDAIQAAQEKWRSVVSLAALSGIPVPGTSSALAYYDSYRTARLPANLLQAQRDYFGAHTYRRLDVEGVFHTEWTDPS